MSSVCFTLPLMLSTNFPIQCWRTWLLTQKFSWLIKNDSDSDLVTELTLFKMLSDHWPDALSDDKQEFSSWLLSLTSALWRTINKHKQWLYKGQENATQHEYTRQRPKTAREKTGYNQKHSAEYATSITICITIPNTGTTSSHLAFQMNRAKNGMFHQSICTIRNSAWRLSH